MIITTATSLRFPEPPHSVPPAKGDRRPVQDRIEAAEREANIAQARLQPHRQGSDDPRLSTPLGRFCASPHGSLPRLGDHCYQAGERYAEIVRDARNAQGFHVDGWSPSDNAAFSLTPAQMSARKDLAIIRRRYADNILKAVISRLPWAMERLCYHQLEPSPYDEGAIINGLVALAVEWGMLKSANRD